MPGKLQELTALRELKIRGCPILEPRCYKDVGMLSFYKFPEDDILIIRASALSTLQGCMDKEAYNDILMKLGDLFKKNSEVFARSFWYCSQNLELEFDLLMSLGLKLQHFLLSLTTSIWETSRVMKGVQHGACGFVSSNIRAISS
ncbi:hypothetical protein GIB67_024264 [Kingdonia uniflora]|uniref:Uncharacterized protein n=1 Tax=Kingdonia uniflora TaxID=39325 RepID=A0A7J7LZQ1_9MAGN|nr:hypothetical protein GIB67_024264 [Kingdonia uniflora]